tara:strand:+ start:72 stop:809 length:738 start_codon:yes stop_codon:yes gene_type:complete
MYIYFGKYFHRHGKDISNANEIKVGKTINLSQRESQLNNTKMTIGYTIVKAFETGEDTDKVEKQLHAILPNRLDGEWFDQDEEDPIISRGTKFMLVSGYPEVDLGTDEDKDVNKVRSEQMSKDVMRAYFEERQQEHPEWFLKSCETWVHTLSMFTKYYVTLGAQNTNGPFHTSVGYKNKPKNGLIKDEDMIPVLKEIFGDKFTITNKKVWGKSNTFKEAFELYQKVVTAGRDGDINLNNETTEEE